VTQLQRSAEPALTAASPGNARAAVRGKGRRLIDVHMHFVPPCYRAALAEAGLDRLDGGMPIPAWSEDLALQALDKHDIESAILSVSSPSVRFVTGDAEEKLARAVNVVAADLAQRHPGRFGFFATLPLSSPEAALTEMTFALDELNADGVVLESNIRGVYLGDPQLAPIFDELNRRGAVLFLHPTSPACFSATGLGRPAPMIEFPMDTARTVVDLIYKGTLKRCPDIKVVVPHGGGAIPPLAPRFASYASRPYINPRPATEEDVFETLASLYYDVVHATHPAPFGALRRIAPVDRLLYGTDWPFGAPGGIERNLEQLEASDLSEADLRAIGRDNALRLFPRFACGCASC
jgi:predicted TIM-barrel fold metal-dependent hydrolase